MTNEDCGDVGKGLRDNVRGVKQTKPVSQEPKVKAKNEMAVSASQVSA